MRKRQYTYVVAVFQSSGAIAYINEHIRTLCYQTGNMCVDDAANIICKNIGANKWVMVADNGEVVKERFIRF